MLQRQTRELKYFLFSQYLADGIRITAEIVLPALILSTMGRLQEGIIISIGAFAVSVSDAPGPIIHKRNGMLYCTICIFIVAILTGLFNHNVVILALWIVLSSFFFTMFSVFGERAGSIGTAALLVLILRMAYMVSPGQAFHNAGLILTGGIWYMTIALFLYRLRPYRPSQRALGECLHEMANYMRIKSGLFDTRMEFEEVYKLLVEQQLVVSNKQDAVRELLFKSRVAMRESTAMGRKLVVTLVSVIDLYEQMMANWYDFEDFRKRYGQSGILDRVAEIMRNLAVELDEIGYDIQSNLFRHEPTSMLPALEVLKTEIEELGKQNISILSLKKVLVNLRKLQFKMDEVYLYFEKKAPRSSRLRSESDYSKFVAHQKINSSVFITNLTLDSAVFRHALRMSIVCILGFVAAKMISFGHHSYWILLTIAIILKPGFSLTKTRNTDRLIGTLAGGIAGLLIVGLVKDQTVLFLIMVFLMIGTYTFQRLRYIVMVILMTPYILILFNFLGLGVLDVAGERLLDTAIGSILAFLGNSFLFPYWEARHFPHYAADVLSANMKYLRELGRVVCGESTNSLEYKLARKNVFVATANMAGAFQRMQNEPKDKQLNAGSMHEFVVLNHVLSSNIAAAAGHVNEKKNYCQPKTIVLLNQALNTLREALKLVDTNYNKIELPNFKPGQQTANASDRNAFQGRLDFIHSLSTDIYKVIKTIT